MSAVYFQLTKAQDQEMKTLMRKEGYSNKAEFFRFLMKFYKYHHDDHENPEMRKIAHELKKILTQLHKQGNLNDKSIKEQLTHL